MYNRVFCFLLLLLIFLLTGCSDMLNYFLSDDDNSFMELVKLTAGDAEDNDEFAYSVAISGDYALVGAPYEDETGINSGAAYIFFKNQNGPDAWGEVKKLAASDGQNDDQFGRSVSLYGDYALVGANSEDGDGNDRGAAYVYGRNDGGANNWGESAKLTAGDAESGDLFGCSVAMYGDKALVGSLNDDGAGSA